MFKMLAAAGLVLLVTACAAPGAAKDPLLSARGSTASGEATAAELGFHAPVYRGSKPDGPN